MLAHAAAALAPGGTFVLVGHDLTNVTDGVGGPSDPSLLYTPDEIAAELPGLEIEKATTVLRDVDGEDRDAIDALGQSATAGAELRSAGKRSRTHSASSGSSR